MSPHTPKSSCLLILVPNGSAWFKRTIRAWIGLLCDRVLYPAAVPPKPSQAGSSTCWQSGMSWWGGGKAKLQREPSLVNIMGSWWKAQLINAYTHPNAAEWGAEADSPSGLNAFRTSWRSMVQTLCTNGGDMSSIPDPGGFESPTCRGNYPVSHSYWAQALEPGTRSD